MPVADGDAPGTAGWPLPLPKTVEEVWSASYPDFVAMVNQTNVMPGAYATLHTLALYSRMDSSSRLLDVACTTGFASRELARLTGCQAIGFDLSPTAVAVARFNSEAGLRVRYVQADGYAFRPDKLFTNAVVGAALGFFADPSRMARTLVDFLDDGGSLLASPFYSDECFPPPVAAIRRDVFGITSPMETYKEAVARFHGLTVVHEEHHELLPETDDEIEHYCWSTIDRAARQSGLTDPAVQDAMLARLRQVKRSTNRLRLHQRYVILVLHYNASEYPNRYVELF